MPSFIDHRTQEIIKKDFNVLREKDQFRSGKSIMLELANKHKKAYSTIYKIVNNNYKLKEAKLPTNDIKKVEVFDEVQQIIRSVPKNKKTFIFTGWEIRVETDKKFISILRSMKKKYNAEVYVTPLWPDDLNFIPPSLKEFNILKEDMVINNNLMFKYVPTHALCVSPVQGWSGVSEKSLIIPGLIKDLITESSHKLCKQVISTGSIGKLAAFLTQYNHIVDEEKRASFLRRWSLVQNRRGGRSYHIAKENTKPSALIVDVLDDNTFFTRFVTMETDGVVYDLNNKFTSDGQVKQHRPESLVTGDLHAYHADLENFNTILEMVKTLNPLSLVIQDVFDGQSVSKHEWHDQYNVANFPSIEEEAEITKEFIRKLDNSVKGQLYYLQSNHDNFLTNFLSDENNYKYLNNYQTAIRLRLYQFDTHKHPIIELLGLGTDFKNVKFIPEEEVLNIAGVSVVHGHIGISGRRVGFRGLQKAYNKLVTGHYHSPQVLKNGVCVGTSSRLNLSYAKGPSGWLHAHCLIQPDGSLQLIPVIYGKWKI